MKVQFDEGSPSEEIVEAGVVAERGVPVDVPDEVGEKLVAQGWKAVGASDNGPTRDELYERAKELGLAGLSKADKDAIATAVAEAEAAAAPAENPDPEPEAAPDTDAAGADEAQASDDADDAEKE